jgi:hypothetical protein
VLSNRENVYLCGKLTNMKVKEFIQQLQQLDKEKDIWIIYDTFSVWEPEVEIINDKDSFAKPGKVGDYVMWAG